jgi:hypothetical protein
MDKESKYLTDKHSKSLKELDIFIEEHSEYFLTTNVTLIVQGLEKYSNITTQVINITSNLENIRFYVTILIILFYFTLFGLIIFAFLKWKHNFLMCLFFIMLFSISGIILFSGLTTTYYYIYADMCDDVHSSIFEDKLPVKGNGLGWGIYCFDSITRAGLTSLNYELNELSTVIDKKMDSIKSSSDFVDVAILQGKVNTAKDSTIKQLLGCDHVYKSISKMETSYCKFGMTWSLYLVKSFNYLVLVVFIIAVGVNRMKTLIDKKIVEEEVKMFFNF